MPTPTARRNSSSTPVKATGVALLLILVLIGLAQCGSTEHSGTRVPATTWETTTPASTPIAEEAPVILPPAPTFDAVPLPDPAPAMDAVPDYSSYDYESYDGSGGYAPAPAYEPAPIPDPAPAPEPASVPQPAPDYGGDGSSGGSVYYTNCTAARAAGAAPLYAGEPGYSSKLDRDGDGVACE